MIQSSLAASMTTDVGGKGCSDSACQNPCIVAELRVMCSGGKGQMRCLCAAAEHGVQFAPMPQPVAGACSSSSTLGWRMCTRNRTVLNWTASKATLCHLCDFSGPHCTFPVTCMCKCDGCQEGVQFDRRKLLFGRQFVNRRLICSRMIHFLECSRACTTYCLTLLEVHR
jgi:hypothetical protein